MITEDVVLRKGAIQSAASEANVSEMVMASSAKSGEKDMILLHSATVAPTSTHEAEPQASCVEYCDSALPENKSPSDSAASL